MPDIPLDIFWGLAAAAALMTAVWLLSLPLRDVSIVDPVWGLGFVVVAVTYAVADGSGDLRQWLVLILVGIWGLRLFAHLAVRKWGTPEDRRYREMREKRPTVFPLRALVTVFLLQAVLMWIISFPLFQAIRDGDPPALTPLDVIAVLVVAFGFFWEAVGDWQLTRFKRDPANEGEVLSSGLWRYTRHPNYFGDAVQWWGFTLLALATADGWWVLVSPIVITLLLMKFSGVGLLERHLSEKPGYEGYTRRTNAFFPWPPRGEA